MKENTLRSPQFEVMSIAVYGENKICIFKRSCNA